MSSLDPMTFHSNATLYSMVIPDNHDALQLKQFVPQNLAKAFSPFESIPNLNNHIASSSERRIQLNWLKLPTRGDIESVLSAWQEFAEEYPRSPLVPYTLWTLTCLYSDAFFVLKSMHPEDAEVLRSVGAEMSQKLIDLPLAPTYLRAEALYMREQLMQGLPLPFKVSIQTVPNKIN
jgi:hypothetical protein